MSPKSILFAVAVGASSLALVACGSSSSNGSPSSTSSSSSSSSSSAGVMPDVSTARRCNINTNLAGTVRRPWQSEVNNNKQLDPEAEIKLNQLGYLPGSQKLAVIPDVPATRFAVVKAGTDNVVFEGDLSGAATWEPADEPVKVADFSALNETGEYQLRVAGLPDSWAFPIAADAYKAVSDAAAKAFYFNRSTAELLAEHAGKYARPLGHPDETVRIHESAATDLRPEGTVFSSPRGWYDAGDFGKYIVNSGISMHSLLSAYEHFPEYYQDQYLNIPESGDTMPDVLHEAMWNLEWMLTMQDPNDGGVYHKLTTKNFSGAVMPNRATSQRFAIGKGTSATLNFAAVMAMASRIYEPYEDQCPGVSQEMLAAAEKAWAWAEENPRVAFSNPADIHTGEYGGSNLSSNFAWAAAELYITTGNDDYYTRATSRSNGIPGWTQTDGLAWISLAHHRDNLTDSADQGLISQRIRNEADIQLLAAQESAYRVSIDVFYWGSNSLALNQAIMLLQAYRLDPENPDSRPYLDAAQSLLDYALGRNATDYSFVTGYGSHTPMHPHHRVSEADDNVEPVPGFVVGGPHSDSQLDCGVSVYPSRLPAKSYVDDWCSYSTNEVTINWNAPLTYVTTAIQTLTE